MVRVHPAVPGILLILHRLSADALCWRYEQRVSGTTAEPRRPFSGVFRTSTSRRRASAHHGHSSPVTKSPQMTNDEPSHARVPQHWAKPRWVQHGPVLPSCQGARQPSHRDLLAARRRRGVCCHVRHRCCGEHSEAAEAAPVPSGNDRSVQAKHARPRDGRFALPDLHLGRRQLFDVSHDADERWQIVAFRVPLRHADFHHHSRCRPGTCRFNQMPHAAESI